VPFASDREIASSVIQQMDGAAFHLSGYVPSVTGFASSPFCLGYGVFLGISRMSLL